MPKHHNLARHVGNECRGYHNAVQLVQIRLDISDRHAFGVQGDDLIFNAGYLPIPIEAQIGGLKIENGTGTIKTNPIL